MLHLLSEKREDLVADRTLALDPSSLFESGLPRLVCDNLTRCDLGWVRGQVT